VSPSIEELQQTIAAVALALRVKYGERTAIAIAIGVPVEDGHDHFAAYVTGPCLAERGLVAWANEAWANQMRLHVTNSTTLTVASMTSGGSS
jgi:hypothetical protein